MAKCLFDGASNQSFYPVKRSATKESTPSVSSTSTKVSSALGKTNGFRNKPQQAK